MEKKKTKKKINSSTFLLMITIVLFAVMYIAGMIIAFLILVVGIQSLKESVIKIFNPEKSL